MKIEDVISEFTAEIEGKEKLVCAKAFEMAKKYSFSLKEIGEYCDKNKIKVAHCQLSCFE